jgi:hypothetical protein
MKSKLNFYVTCYLIFTVFMLADQTVNAQVFTGTVVELYHPTLGSNSDYTAIYRADTQTDRTVVRIMMGDEYTSDFQIGYTDWQSGQWNSTFTLDGWGNGYFQGNLGIGTTAPNEKLTVNGTIYGREVRVDLNVPGPDYVFEENYNLPSLTEVESYIKANKHLPEVPSAREMEEKGINLSEMNMLLLKKVEELTL